MFCLHVDKQVAAAWRQSTT